MSVNWQVLSTSWTERCRSFRVLRWWKDWNNKLCRPWTKHMPTDENSIGWCAEVADEMTFIFLYLHTIDNFGISASAKLNVVYLCVVEGGSIVVFPSLNVVFTFKQDLCVHLKEKWLSRPIDYPALVQKGCKLLFVECNLVCRWVIIMMFSLYFTDIMAMSFSNPKHYIIYNWCWWKFDIGHPLTSTRKNKNKSWVQYLWTVDKDTNTTTQVTQQNKSDDFTLFTKT